MTAEAREQSQQRRTSRMRWRPTSWLAWLLWVLIVVFGEAALIPYQIDWFGLTHPFYLGSEGFVDNIGGPILVFAIASLATVGAVVATLRPKNGVGWLCLALSILLVLVLLEAGISAYGVPWYVLEPLSSLAWNLTIPPLAVTLMLLIFPDGRLPSRRWWAVVGIALAGYALTFLEVYMPGDEAQSGWPVGVWLSLAALLASVVAVVLRWRRSTDQERQQLKWLVYMVTLAVIGGLAALALGGIWANFGYVTAIAILMVTAGVGLGIPAAIGVAVLRYRLYDIDRIINRTLVYGALTALLAAGYFATIMALQGIGNLVFQVPFRALTGQNSALATVAATLAMAALFNPLRHRIQSFIDRSFYRRKYDAAKMLEEFSMKLRDETDLDAVSDDLVGVVRETMQPAHVSLWLRPDPALKDKKRALILESGREEK
jgi:hypothetical protein